LRAFETAPSAPVMGDLHCRKKRADQNCSSIRGTKNCYGGDTRSGYAFRFSFPNGGQRWEDRFHFTTLNPCPFSNRVMAAASS
jgi:hypothetical protein